ncbi:MAG: virginiamycin lyase [Thermomicrobiales bacterium]|jgi:virginiamycin B lyase|nr:virginiamycin lyase [Thermomicrobiales bacterium]
MPTTRRHVLTTSFALIATAKSASAQTATPDPSPPESCLTLETFPVPGGDRPHDVAPAADGVHVWYTGQGSGILGSLDPTTGNVERIPLGDGSSPHGVIVGPDGNAWVTDGSLNAIVKVDADSHDVTAFPVPGDHLNLNTPAIDGDGAVWFTGQSGIVGRLDPTSGQVDVVEAPRGRGPYGIDATPSGDIWFVSLAGSYLARASYANGSIEIALFDPPTSGAGLRRVWSDSQDVLWISEWNAGQLARFDPTTETWQEWKLPGDAPQAYSVYVDERDDVWLSDFGANSLVRFDPDTEAFASIALPDPDAAVRQILGRPGEIWGAESGVDKLVVVRTSCDG